MPLFVLEGLDGSGKTTQLELLFAQLREQDIPFVHYRDPGGTALGEQLRSLLLDPAHEVCQLSELFGYLLSRAQLVEERIKPALAAGMVVVLDRFWYSTTAYQCFGLGLPRAEVQPAIDLAHAGLAVDCALYLDMPVAAALARRSAASGTLDRIEGRGLAYLQRVEAGYHALVAEGHLQAIDAAQDKAVVAAAVWGLFKAHLSPS